MDPPITGRDFDHRTPRRKGGANVIVSRFFDPFFQQELTLRFFDPIFAQEVILIFFRSFNCTRIDSVILCMFGVFCDLILMYL